MGLFTREQFAGNDDDAGVFIDGLGQALVTYVAMQNGVTVTVHDAARCFNTTPEIIAEAVENAMWIYIQDGRLELDGD